ncbi:MAG: family 20 glycosylhydrolase [Bacteroidales bacterium]
MRRPIHSLNSTHPKRLTPVLLIPVPALFILLMCSCARKPGDNNAGRFVLLPRPVEMEMNGSSGMMAEDIKQYYSPDGSVLPACPPLLEGLEPAGEVSGAQVVFVIDTSLEVNSEGYILEIDRKQISILGKDRPGLMYGFVTLHQLMEDAMDQGVNLPRCRIRDYPLLAYRAIHLDMKHHMEKREYYYRLMDLLARYKINAVIAEMEDKLAYERQPMVGSSDAFSMDEWKQLSEYARDRNIEISPLIQGLGHASFILKNDVYRSLRDDPESDWAFNPLDPGTYDVQFDLYRDAMEATPYGRFLHVGGDEVHTTGRGSGQSPLELQLIWLNKVCEFAEEHGRTPIFWDDMPLKHAGVYWPMFNPELSTETVDSIWEAQEPVLEAFLDRFPRNCIYMRWNYSDPEAYGNEKAMGWFRENGFQVMGATAGQTRWVLMPQEESNMENIKTFALSSIHGGLDGLLLTLWDDDSPHFELYIRGIIAFAEYTWAGDRLSKAEIKSAYRHREFSPAGSGEAYAFIDLLEMPVAFWNNALLETGFDRRRLRHMEDPSGTALIGLPDPEHPGNWSRQYGERLNQAAELVGISDTVASRIRSLQSLALRNEYRLEVYDMVNRISGYTPSLLLALKAYDEAEDGESRTKALERVEELVHEFYRLRAGLEQVYGRTRVLNKPDDYILDQDLHHHLANQTRSFDWLFTSELLFLEKMRKQYSFPPEG